MSSIKDLSAHLHPRRSHLRRLTAKLGWIAAIACAVMAITLVAAPAVRAGVGKWFAWYSHIVVTPDSSAGTDALAGSGFGIGVGSGSVTFEREAYEHLSARATHSLDEAREFLGRGVALPPALEGREMLLWSVDDKDGNLEMIGVSCVEAGFWARNRPANDHKVGVTYGSDFTVTTETRVIAGRTALLVSVAQASGKTGPAEIWMEDGSWVYELRENMGNMETLVKLAESMR